MPSAEAIRAQIAKLQEQKRLKEITASQFNGLAIPLRKQLRAQIQAERK